MKHTVSINNSQGKKITLKVTCNAIEYTYIEEYAGDITLPSSGNEGESEEGDSLEFEFIESHCSV